VMGLGVGVQIDADLAADWVRGSLAQGSDLARLVTQRLPQLTIALVLSLPSILQGRRLVLDDVGRGLSSSASDAVAKEFFMKLAKKMPLTLIVEDDLARRGDPRVGRAAFVDDRLIRWEEINEDGFRAAKLLRSGASGYPLNAFICRGSSRELNLEEDRQLLVIEEEQIVDSTDAVVASVWDAEAYVAVCSPELIHTAD
jgi:hypothetical protein